MRNLSEKIWGRGEASQIMKDARERFHWSSREDLSDAYVALASVHYSLVKRYISSSRQKPLALWHMWCAARNARKACVTTSIKGFSPEQFDVLARIRAKAPSWLGGNPFHAMSMLNTALFHVNWRADEMKPHTRALMLITLGELEFLAGNRISALNHHAEARKLIPAIETEDSDDRDRQLVRVMTSVGFFYYDHAGQSERYWSEQLLRRAIELAHTVSRDQELKILAEWRKRGR